MTHPTVSSVRPTSHVQVSIPTTLGLDISDRLSHFHVLRGDKVTLAQGKVPTEHADLQALFTRWQGCQLVIEACSHSPWISRLGAACGLAVVVANPRRTELISKSDRKCDRVDAEFLARMGQGDLRLLAPIQHRSERTQEHLMVQRSRSLLVGMRTQLVNHVRGSLKPFGRRAPRCSAESFQGRVLPLIPKELRPALDAIVRLIGQVTTQIARFDKRIERMCHEELNVTQLLQEVPGVGPVLSFTYVLTVESPERFQRTRDVGAYIGLVPKSKSSGTSDPQLRITKAGDRELRRLLVLAANYILGRFGPDCDLRRFGLRILGDTPNKRRKKAAKVAVARKLAVLLLHLWKTGEHYDPFHQACKRNEPVPA